MHLQDDDEFIVIGSDGLWDVISSQHAVNFVGRELRRGSSPSQTSHHLIDQALSEGSRDNVTVLIAVPTLIPDDRMNDDSRGRRPDDESQQVAAMSEDPRKKAVKEWLDDDDEPELPAGSFHVE